MARAGILYSDVAKAASLLVNQSKSVTVDNVRDAMGGTGSKSTIAPMLKRWKLEHQEQVEASTAGLSATLIQAVKAVYDHLQAEAGQQIELAQQRHRDELQAMHKQGQLLLDEKTALARRSDALAAEVKNADQAIAKLQSEKQVMSISLATLESDRSGLQLRLADRSAEVAALNQQLTLARAQFDHYQEATAAQRAEEKQAYEHRTARLELDLAASHQRLLGQQSTLAVQETQISHLNAENDRLQELNSTINDEVALLRSERNVLAHELKVMSSTCKIATEREASSQHTLAANEQLLAVRTRETYLLSEQLTKSELLSERLNQEKIELLQRCATLEATGKGIGTSQ
ncbi:MAG: DNA-binding protein [Burkholderiales bacterium]|nr:DNA-binding protein [Burkholderiales bacterium]